jgi:hypothetical protein
LKKRLPELPGGLFVCALKSSEAAIAASAGTFVLRDPYFTVEASAADKEESMFCDKCGAPVQPDQRFCGRCGREFAGAPIGFPRRSRVGGHIRLLGILWLALSALNAVGGVILYILANTLFVRLPEMSGGPPAATAWLHPFLSVVGIIVVVKAAAGFLAGWGLLQREPWARMLTIVLAFLALFNIPFGTALGIYTLWVLMPQEAATEYSRPVPAP